MGDVQITVTEDRPVSGMWHCGPNACWITATHLPTMAQVRIYSGSIKSQNQVRQTALAMLSMIVDEHGAEPCQFPERVGAREATND